jgi:hypothetical protein
LQHPCIAQVHVQIHNALDYNSLPTDQQQCIDDFLSSRRNANHLGINHDRLDIGAWLCMLQLPVHPQFIQIIQDHRKELPYLLPREEDRDMLEKIAHLHRYTKQHDKD